MSIKRRITKRSTGAGERAGFQLDSHLRPPGDLDRYAAESDVSTIQSAKDMPMHSLTRLVTAATVGTLLLCGCGKSNTPPHVYTAATKGAASVDDLVDQFKKAYTARDADAAMQMFYWQSADDQDFWWVSLNEEFAIPFDAIEVIPPQGKKESIHPPPKTALPVVSRLRITTKKTPTSDREVTLLIGKKENGFYFVPPINK